jgi:exodeoxyribonuclease-3
MLKIATWNVNSVKSRITHLLELLRADNAPDILLLQELKCQSEAFPYMEIEDAGYNVAVHGQKSYNGVAVLSKFPIDEVVKGLGKGDSGPGEISNNKLEVEISEDMNSLNHVLQPLSTKAPEEARYIECVISLPKTAVRVASVYVPNGQDPGSEKFKYKMAFFERLYSHAKDLLKLDEMLVIGGDYNVAPNDIDVFDPKTLEGTTCFHPQERKHFRALTGLGLTDIYRAMHPQTQGFSWWDYRAGAWQHNKGMRIDHLLLSAQAADKAIDSGIDLTPRDKDKPSDHTPVWCRLRI